MCVWGGSCFACMRVGIGAVCGVKVSHEVSLTGTVYTYTINLQLNTNAYQDDNALSKGNILMDTDSCFRAYISLSVLSIEIINQREAH